MNKGRKQTEEHIRKRVKTRIKNNSYLGQNKGHPATNTKPNSGSFKKGSSPWNKDKVIEFDIDNLKKLHFEDGESLIDISKKLGVSDRTLSNKLKRIGLSPIPKNKPTKNTINKIKTARKTQKQTFTSSIERKIDLFLKALGIEFYTHKYMDIAHGYQCDFLIPSMKIVIEADGEYWHNYPQGREIDRIRTIELNMQGYRVIRLWERQIKSITLPQFQLELDR